MGGGLGGGDGMTCIQNIEGISYDEILEDGRGFCETLPKYSLSFDIYLVMPYCRLLGAAVRLLYHGDGDQAKTCVCARARACVCMCVEEP